MNFKKMRMEWEETHQNCCVMLCHAILLPIQICIANPLRCTIKKKDQTMLHLVSPPILLKVSTALTACLPCPLYKCQR